MKSAISHPVASIMPDAWLDAAVVSTPRLVLTVVHVVAWTGSRSAGAATSSRVNGRTSLKLGLVGALMFLKDTPVVVLICFSSDQRRPTDMMAERRTRPSLQLAHTLVEGRMMLGVVARCVGPAPSTCFRGSRG